MVNVDLHCHSKVSDGTLTPAALAARAKENGVDLWAMTDHDEVGGIAEARGAAASLRLPFVPGVEISVTWSGQTVHIVGLRIDENNRALTEGLAVMRGGRAARAREVSERLAAIGVPDAFDGALKYVGNPELISRTHFARYLIELGLCSNLQDVFSTYLGEGTPAYVPHRWVSLENAVGWIRSAGGVAVIAHPGRYKFSGLQFDALFREFRELGGTAIEVVTGSHTVDQYDTYAKIANKYDFLASRGSDFHGPGESRVDLGALPALPPSVTPVWHDWNLSH
jgi:hypothetical protein